MNGICTALGRLLHHLGPSPGVIKVTRDNKLKWILAGHDGWGNSGWDGSGPSPAPYLLTAVDANGNPEPDIVQSGEAAAPDFDWTWGQHCPSLLPSGNLLCFDNGFRRWFQGVGACIPAARNSRSTRRR